MRAITDGEQRTENIGNITIGGGIDETMAESVT